MREFTDPYRAEPADPPVAVVEQPHYVEVRLRESAGTYTRPVFLLKADDATGIAATCWGQRFDAVLDGFRNPKYGAIWADAYRRIWPTFFALLDNAMDERYGDGALAQLVDRDDMNRKWFVAVLFDQAGGDPAAQRAVDRVAELSVALTQDIPRQLGWKDKLKIGARGGAVGYREGKEVADRWSERLDWLKVILGG